YAVKRLFVQRRAAKAHKEAEAAGFDGAALAADLAARFGEPFPSETDAAELMFARHVDQWMADEAAHGDDLALAARYAAGALYAPAGKAQHRPGILFKSPHKLDMEHLVPVTTDVVNGVTRMALPREHWRHREGFALTDAGTDLKGALDQTNYCIWCHNQ